MTSRARLSVDAAAERLGITPDAVRSRIKRGTLWLDQNDVVLPGIDGASVELESSSSTKGVDKQPVMRTGRSSDAITRRLMEVTCHKVAIVG